MRVNLCVIVIVKENQDRDPAGSFWFGNNIQNRELFSYITS